MAPHSYAPTLVLFEYPLRIALDTLVRELTVWMHDRNVQQSTIDWRFTTPDARIKLKRLYPAILP